MKETLADSHVHLDRYSHREVSSMLRRARVAGVSHLLTVGVDLPSSQRALALARRRGVRAAVGVHPTRLHHVGAGSALSGLGDLIGQGHPAALGEVGLDEQAVATAEDQVSFLVGCLELAAERQLPLILHVVGGHEAALAILAESTLAGRRTPVVVHYFVGDQELARRYLELYCYISVGTPVTRQHNVSLRAAIAQVPPDRLLLETDTYPLPGRTTEPCDLPEICAAVAEIKAMPLEAVAARTTANFLRLF